MDIWQEIVANACCDKEVITVCKLDETNSIQDGRLLLDNSEHLCVQSRKLGFEKFREGEYVQHTVHAHQAVPTTYALKSK